MPVNKRTPPTPTWLTWLTGRAFLAVGLLLVVGGLALPAWRLARPPEPTEAPTSGEGGLPLLLPETPLQEELADAGDPLPEQQPFPVPEQVVVTPPERLVIPAIDVDAPVVPVGWETISLNGQSYGRWQVPDGSAVGWHDTSSGPGQGSNTVLNGHHNLYGQVFRRLVELEVGDTLTLWAGGEQFDYVVTASTILPERNQPLEVRLANAARILPTQDERVTLVTCWPYSGNSHRLIVVAKPAAEYDLFFETTYQ